MDLGGWLQSLGLEPYDAAFRENEISERAAEDLKDLGVTIVGDPNHRGLPPWPLSDACRRASMHFDNVCAAVGDPVP
jgi:hypothetical protein